MQLYVMILSNYLEYAAWLKDQPSKSINWEYSYFNISNNITFGVVLIINQNFDNVFQQRHCSNLNPNLEYMIGAWFNDQAPWP